MIAFLEVRVRYSGAAADAVAGVSFEARNGSLTAVVGPNGSGKSTLVRALLGRASIVGGAVRVDGDDAASIAPREFAQRVAVVAQREDSVFPLPVREYVSLGRHARQGAWAAPSAYDHDVIDRALRTSGIDALRDRQTDTLSGGEWQLARLARAIAQDAQSFVLDEPTTFLDIAHEMACFELLAALARGGRAVLVVSHQLNLVARFADHVVLLSKGVVAAAGTPLDVMRGDVLERVYEWPLVVSRDPAVGAPTLVPLRRHASPPQ
ncbi:MAG: ABC transporter ATP-binding protein [Gemmatimonadaceae bacterium]